MRPSTIVVILFVWCNGAVAGAQHIHVLMFAHTADQSIGNGSEATVEMIQGAFAELVPAAQYTITVKRSSENWRSSMDVISAIENTRVREEDAFVLLIHCHGGHKDKNHFLEMPNGETLWSDKLREAASLKNCKLRLVITDSCHVPFDYASALDAEPWDLRHGIAPVMQELFFNHNGVMHMNSSRPGEFAYTDADGSWFFKVFTRYLRFYPNTKPSWSYMDEYLHQKLGEEFSERCSGKHTYNGYTATSLGVIYWSMARNSIPRYGAVALNETTAKWSYTYNHRNRNDAESEALRSAGSGSRVVLVTAESYFSFAQAPLGGWGAGYGDTPEQATAMALKYAKQHSMIPATKFCVFNGHQ